MIALLLACAAATSPGARVERPEWIAALEARDKKIEVSLEARGGFHINREYPLRFTLAGGERIERARFAFRLCTGQAVEVCDGRAEIPVKGRVKGTLAFSVCSTERCIIEKVQLAR